MLRLSSLVIPLGMSLFAQSPSVIPDRPIDRASRSQIGLDVAKAVSELYVYPDVGEQIAMFLREQVKDGAYDPMTSAKAFAKALTADLRSVNHDLHFEATYSVAAPDPPGPNTWNFGYVKAEVLSGNIGYLEVVAFLPRKLAQNAAAAAMMFLANTDALIIDLRANRGGAPDGVSFLCSYLFGDNPVHLNDLYWRNADRPVESWTDPKVPGGRYGPGKPVYVLTSRETFSGAEEFAYDVQQQKRAKIVGEPTGGGSHPGLVLYFSDDSGNQFRVFIPCGRAVNPISKKDWEGTGVIPDIRASPPDAQRTAQVDALRTLLANAIGNRKQALAVALAEFGQKE